MAAGPRCRAFEPSAPDQSEGGRSNTSGGPSRGSPGLHLGKPIESAGCVFGAAPHDGGSRGGSRQGGQGRFVETETVGAGGADCGRTTGRLARRSWVAVVVARRPWVPESETERWHRCLGIKSGEDRRLGSRKARSCQSTGPGVFPVVETDITSAVVLSRSAPQFAVAGVEPVLRCQFEFAFELAFRLGWSAVRSGDWQSPPSRNVAKQSPGSRVRLTPTGFRAVCKTVRYRGYARECERRQALSPDELPSDVGGIEIGSWGIGKCPRDRNVAGSRSTVAAKPKPMRLARTTGVRPVISVFVTSSIGVVRTMGHLRTTTKRRGERVPPAGKKLRGHVGNTSKCGSETLENRKTGPDTRPPIGHNLIRDLRPNLTDIYEVFPNSPDSTAEPGSENTP